MRAFRLPVRRKSSLASTAKGQPSRWMLPWLVRKSGSTSDELTPQHLELMADILGGLYGEDALAFFDEGDWVKKSWNAADHPRDKNGRFIQRGSSEAATQAKVAIKQVLKRPHDPDTHKALVEHLSILSVKQLHDLKKEHNLSASAALKEQLVQKLAERLVHGNPKNERKTDPHEGSLRREIIRRGGLDPAQIHKDFNFKEDIKEYGLLRIMKRGGQQLDDLADSLHEEGYFYPPEGMDKGEYLLSLLQKNAKSQHYRDGQKDFYKTEYEEAWNRYEQEMKDAYEAKISERDIREAVSRGEADGISQAQSELSDEGEDFSREDRPYDPDGFSTDDFSFDFGMNATEEPKPEPQSKPEPQPEKKPASTPMDHGELNVPLGRRRGGSLNSQIDRWKRDEAKKASQKRKTDAQVRRENKAKAKDLAQQHANALAEQHARRQGVKISDVKKTIDQMVKWEPEKAIAMFEKFVTEQDAAKEQESPTQATVHDYLPDGPDRDFGVSRLESGNWSTPWQHAGVQPFASRAAAIAHARRQWNGIKKRTEQNAKDLIRLNRTRRDAGLPDRNYHPYEASEIARLATEQGKPIPQGVLDEYPELADKFKSWQSMPTRNLLPWLIRKGQQEADEHAPEQLAAMAEVLGGLFGEEALSLFDEGAWVAKSWNEAQHPRGKNGRFIKRGSDEAVSAAKNQVRNILNGNKTADTHKSLVEHLSLLTVKQLHDLKREHGLKCSARLRDQLVQKLAERLGATMPDNPAEQPSDDDYGHNVLYNVDEQQADAMLDKVFGRKDSHQIIGHAVGAPKNAEIVVESVEPYPDDPNSMGVVIEIRHPYLEGCTRYIGIDSNGKRFIKNEYIRAKELGSGIGMEIFTRQVEQASKMGFAYIGTHAAGDARHQRSFLQAIHRNFPETTSIDDTAKAINELRKTDAGRAFLDKVYVPFNGYYTWPRFGYDMSLTDPKGLQEGDASVYEAARAKFPDAKTVLDIFETEEGRQWWKDNGADVYNAKFDLSPNSRSMKVLKAYQAERAARKKWLRSVISRSKMRMRLKKFGASASNSARPNKSCLPWLAM